ncbi:PREDICTED: uncharacterized protein LOC108768068 isoform X1 [Trachymyrmex cornetzi]|uniref:uncharacterized protein LOC108768068 isoform X1 n=1 Tax=Trachymyrmex cornetzi TaxID=471704 RepID=UPI00084EFE6C|nr:PREDICTED: uncharacterized protein LOC108768068 isoform X1 [Trachymyrmex cornetzi]
MFESDDWIFEDTFDDVGGKEEETKKKSYSSYQNKEKTQSVKRRKIDSCEVLLARNTFSQKSKLDTIANIQDNDLPSKNKNDVSRGDLLLEIFQKNTCRETFDLAKDIQEDPSGIQKETQCFQSEMVATSKVFQYKESRGKSDESMNTKVRFNKEVKLIRLFPGPAGLVSDVKNDNISATSYLNSVEELKNKTSTKRIEIKSQDERNLCGEKAWKLLLNDLPNNFLQDYKISTVKDNANANHCDSTRVKFIAGVVDYVDYSHDDPFVILKDSSGSIEGTVHRDIPSTYPGVLEPNIVIFLCDVGLLKTTTYVVTNKYHILVSLVNLLAIYSDKGRIVSTPLMESVISHTLNSELNRINNCMSISEKSGYISGLQKIDESHKALLQTSSSVDNQGSIKDHESELAKNLLLQLESSTSGKYESGEIFKNKDKDCKVTNEILEYLDHSMDTNDLDMDVFFTTDCNFTSLEDQNCRDHLLSSISQTSKIQRCNLQMQNTKCLENTKNKSTICSKQTKEQHLPQTLKKYTDVKTYDTHYSRENCFSSCNDALCRDSNLNVKFTLSAIKRNVENSKTLVSYFIDDKYDAYDSDDEILSQLDVDNIVDKRKEDG